MVSIGRKPNTENLGLENTRVELDEGGFIKVNDKRQTKEKNIYAIGDVAEEPLLAHKATFEAKVAVNAILGKEIAQGDGFLVSQCLKHTRSTNHACKGR